MSFLNSKAHLGAIKEIIILLTKHRQLTFEMVKRELKDRYVGKVFGFFWAIGHPIVIMSIYVFIFAFVFKAKVGGTREMPLDFTIYLLAGLIPWLTTMDAMSKGTTVITSNASLVRQVVFPLEILPVKTVLASFSTQIIMFVFLSIYIFIRYGGFHLIFLMIIVLFFFQLLFLIGINYVLSAVGAYFRDLRDFIQVFCVVGIYIMPIFYLPESVPGLFKPILYINPFSYMIWCYQDVIYFGRFEHPYAWGIFIIESTVVFYLGYRVFRKFKTTFGNVL